MALHFLFFYRSRSPKKREKKRKSEKAKAKIRVGPFFSFLYLTVLTVLLHWLKYLPPFCNQTSSAAVWFSELAHSLRFNFGRVSFQSGRAQNITSPFGPHLFDFESWLFNLLPGHFSSVFSATKQSSLLLIEIYIGLWTFWKC